MFSYNNPLRRFIRFFYYNFYIKVFHKYEYEVVRAIGNDCKSLLDIGCGAKTPIKSRTARISDKIHCVGVDSFKSSIIESKRKHLHNEYVLMDVLKISEKFKPKSFDCVVALDLIEHLKKEDGLKLLNVMESIAKKRVIIHTPNGFQPQKEFDNNSGQVHLSGWTPEEMKKRGYKIIGTSGWKPLRGELAGVKFWPEYFWIFISDITQFIVRKFPQYAYTMLCTKDKS